MQTNSPRHEAPTIGTKRRVLVVNAGSSSIKLSLLGDSDRPLAQEELPAPRAQVDSVALRAALDGDLGEADVVGHRVVHGGERFHDAVVIDGSVKRALAELAEMAPLHQSKSLAALDAVSEALPEVVAVACFDTAFHTTMPARAYTYALPAAWRERWPLRRYGFHGLSHAWVARRVPELLGFSRAGSRIVSCHLGAGASLCAIADGLSVDTTMGFTPLEGLVMATRSGSVDPGLMLWLMEHTGMPEDELGGALEHESGLLGLAGTPDMREVLARAKAGDAKAGMALDIYLHRLRGGIASMSAALGGLDAVAFTGGVGEHSPEIRSRCVTGLDFLGLAVDADRNERADGDADISAPEAGARTFVVQAREDLEIARQCRVVLAGRS